MAEIVVADASPLIAFGRLGQVGLLSQIFAKVIVPRAVFEETLFRPELPDAKAISEALRAGMLTVDESSSSLAQIPPDAELGIGEAAAIGLAVALGHGVLIDEKVGRAVAEERHLKVIGTVGVLLIARKRGLIPALKPALEQLSASGFHLSSRLIHEALRQAGE